MLTLLLTAVSASPRNAKQPSPEVQQLADQAFRYYSDRQTDKYFDAVSKVKKATENSDEETYV